MTELTAVVPCMGRLAHLQATLPVLLQGPLDALIVDYSCPDGVGAWVDAVYGKTGRVAVESVPARRNFHKPEALNRGAARAIERTPDAYLCFLDADTVVAPALWEWLLPQLRRDRFWFVEGWPGKPDVTGLLVVHASAFERVGGYDERMRGWGAEDLDLRLRLFYELGLGFGEIPTGYVHAIPHPDELRVDNYVVKNKRASYQQNLRLLADNFHRVSGRKLRALDCDRTMWKLLGVYQWWQKINWARRRVGLAPWC